jgi:hypothetical protein
MSTEVKYCFESDEIGDLAQNMADEQIRRLVVLNDNNRLVGVVSLGDLATGRDGRLTKIPDKPSGHGHLPKALSCISKAGSHHCANLSDSKRIGTVEAANADVAIKELCAQ